VIKKNIGSLVKKVLGDTKKKRVITTVSGTLMIGFTVLAVVSGLSIVQSSYLEIESRINIPELSTLPEPPEESFEYCKTNEDSDEVSRYIAGDSNIQPTILSPRDFHQNESVKEVPIQENLQTIDNLVLTKQSIIPVTSSNPTDRYQLLVVGVGYTDGYLDDLSENATLLAEIFSGMDIVDISYLNTPYVLSISHVQRYSFLSNDKDGDSLMTKVNEIMPIDGILIVLNSKKYLGGKKNKYPVVVSYNNGLYLPIHELAHLFGLSDAENRYYIDSDFGGSELFRNSDELEHNVSRAVRVINPPIGDTGNVCDGKKVYRFYPGEFNIMGPLISDPIILNRLQRGLPLFNPLQQQIMRYFIADTITNRPGN